MNDAVLDRFSKILNTYFSISLIKINPHQEETKMASSKESISLIHFLSNGLGAITPLLSGSVPSALVGEMIANALWSLFCVGTFITGILALCYVLSKNYDTAGAIISIPTGYFGQSAFPLIVIGAETFRYPAFSYEYISQILSEYLGLHLLVGILVWVIVWIFYRK